MNIVKKAILITAFLFAFFLPINTKFANGCLIAFAIFSIIISYKDYQSNKKIKIIRFVLQTTTFVVVLLLLGLLVTDDVGFALKYFERYSSYLLLPVFLYVLQLSVLNKIKVEAFRGLVAGTLLSSVILLVVNFKHYFEYKNGFSVDTDLFSYHFTYHEFAEILGFHPTFLGMYFVFSLVLIYEFFKGKNILFLKIGASVILITALLFLNSRVPFLLFFIYLGVLSIRWLRKCWNSENGFKKIILSVFCFSILLGVITYSLKNTYIYQRMTNQLVWELTENKGTSFDGVYSSDSRISRWKAIIIKSMERPLFGFGSASEDRVVLDVYRDNNLQYALANKYGPHNQYFSFLLEYGLIGFFLFCYYLGINIFNQLKQKNTIFCLFFIFVAVACIFDSLMYINAGVIFFAFFGNLFTIINWKKNDLT